MVAGSRAVLYTAGEPVAADRPYQARLRAPGELIALAAPDGPARYTVLSQIADADPARLRRAGEVYPATVISLYLQLPDGLDPRLAALTAEWAAGAATPYDRALAIESALRQLPYTLDVPAPPADRELVAWFLFDLRQGYCDYFASAMVVLARLSGIPARLAVGYAPGDYDQATETFIITELGAHSWPELYFPGAGWVRFEPTPAQAVPVRVDLAAADPVWPDDIPPAWDVTDVEAGMAELRALAAENQAVARRGAALMIAAGVLNGLALAGWLAGWRAWRRGAVAPEGIVSEPAASFQRLVRWGNRLGWPLRVGDTPREYAAAVARQAASIASRSRWRRAHAAAAAQTVAFAGERLAEVYERSLFGPEDGAPRPVSRLPVAAFRRLWLVRRFGDK